jgi:hypothetical protein
MRRMIGTGLLLAVTIAGGAPACAWDYPGHRIVGAIADLVLQQHYPKAYERVQALLVARDASGKEIKRTLNEVAVFPDCAKKNNIEWCKRAPSDEEKEYASRNPRHDTYHYTDIPVEQRKYVAVTAGTAATDVVEMISYVVAQLRGKAPAKKDGVALTDAEAVWLLAHMVGDIHQPLHVGAKYYDRACRKGVDPNRIGNPPTFGIGETSAETIGGNRIKLVAAAPAVPPAPQLHLFWDGAAVVQAMQAAGVGGSEREFARLLAAAPPSGWQTKGGVETWARRWASENLPLAAEAHRRLSIRRDGVPGKDKHGKIECAWMTTADKSYQDWAKEQVRLQLAKAGFRLAALMQAIFDPSPEK